MLSSTGANRARPSSFRGPIRVHISKGSPARSCVSWRRRLRSRRDRRDQGRKSSVLLSSVANSAKSTIHPRRCSIGNSIFSGTPCSMSCLRLFLKSLDSLVIPSSLEFSSALLIRTDSTNWRAWSVQCRASSADLHWSKFSSQSTGSSAASNSLSTSDKSLSFQSIRRSGVGPVSSHCQSPAASTCRPTFSAIRLRSRS